MRSSFLKITGALVLIALVAACGATAPPRQTSSRVEPAKGGYDFKSEGRIPAPAGGSAQPQADVEEIAVGDTSLDVSEADAPRDSTPPASTVVADSTADGFRIQVFASADRDVSQNARNVAAERLGIPAYLDLDAGVYKVRVGDYLRRDDAAAALPSVRAQYYPDAWVVPARIHVPRSR
jgi:hypothetical protein